MDAATINSIRRKIARLEQMTLAHGCTPNEVENAQALIATLRAKLPSEHAQSTYSQNYQQERPTWHEIHKHVHDYWVNEYFREFRQPLRERQQQTKPNPFDELLSGLAGGGSPGRFRF